MNKIIKSASAVLAAASIVGINAAPAVMAWGDNSGVATGRTTHTLNCASASDCTITPSLGNTVTFNSITNNPNLGDERNFVGARENTGVNAGINNTWNANEIVAEDGKEYLVRIYAHNNNPNGTNGIAKDVTLHYTLPTEAGTELSVQGSIDSSNATPSRVWDDVVFKSADGRKFYLDYIEGSALYENNGVGANGGVQLSDSVITSNGAKIGYDSLNGEIPGCFQYASYTTIRVKAVYLDNSYVVEKKVRNVTAGEKEFKDTVDAKIGDTVEYQIYYHNTTADHIDHVIVKDILPYNMDYVDGSTKLYNTTNPEGIINTNDTIASDGINIGGYDADGDAYVRFRAVVTDKNLVCGTNKLVNWGQVGYGNTTIQDNAFVMVKKTEGCENTPETPKETPKENVKEVTSLPTTGAGSIVAGIIGAGAIVTSAGYYIASRKSLR